MNDSGTSLCFPRAWGGPDCHGVIKANPADFCVFERLGFEPAGTGEHAWLKIRKTNTNTGWVAARLADVADVRPFDVGYAGRKDRRAVTEQWFSCYLPGRMDPDWQALPAGDMEIITVTRHRRKLRKGAHQGNFFEIRIRHINGQPASLENRLARVKADGFPNFFGEQRFGRQANNLKEADRLFAGERISRVKRDIYISAARAYLFNRVLSERIHDGSWCLPGDGGAIRTGPLYGAARDAPPEPVPDGYNHWNEGLKRLKVKAARRPLCVIPEDFDWKFEDNDTLLLSFALPPGAYATSLLRELIYYEESVSG